jgi:hypothetical protein
MLPDSQKDACRLMKAAVIQVTQACEGFFELPAN